MKPIRDDGPRSRDRESRFRSRGKTWDWKNLEGPLRAPGVDSLWWKIVCATKSALPISSFGAKDVNNNSHFLFHVTEFSSYRPCLSTFSNNYRPHHWKSVIVPGVFLRFCSYLHIVLSSLIPDTIIRLSSLSLHFFGRHYSAALFHRSASSIVFIQPIG
jgi:hypothetical protein